MHVDIAMPMSREIGKLTEKKLLATAIGQKTVECIREGIANHYIRAKSVQDFLDDWKKTSKFGVCYGQAHAIMLASRDISFDKGKKVVKNAQKIDAICFQILHELQVATKSNIEIKKICKKEIKEVNKKIEKYTPKAEAGKKWAKRKIKKIQEEKKAVDKYIHKAGMAQGTSGVGVLTKIEKNPATQYHEKIARVEKELLSLHGKLTLIKKSKFSKENKDEFLEEMKKLHKENKDKDVQVLVTMRSKEGAGHALSIAVGKNKALYDQNLGLATPKQGKAFFKFLKEHFTSREQGFPIKNFKIEVFHRQA